MGNEETSSVATGERKVYLAMNNVIVSNYSVSVASKSYSSNKIESVGIVSKKHTSGWHILLLLIFVPSALLGSLQILGIVSQYNSWGTIEHVAPIRFFIAFFGIIGIFWIISFLKRPLYHSVILGMPSGKQKITTLERLNDAEKLKIAIEKLMQEST